jgi:hypothetical protein
MLAKLWRKLFPRPQTQIFVVLPHTPELIRQLHHLIITTPAGDVHIHTRDGGRQLAIPLSLFNQLKGNNGQPKQ